jgi:serine protease Do
MLSAPELRRRATSVALCLLLAGSLAVAQTRRRPPQPDTPSSVNARRIAQQVLPSVVLITMEGGCYGSGFFVAGELVATNKHVLECGGRGSVRVAGSGRPFPIISTWRDPRHDLALVRVTGAGVRPLPLSEGWPSVGEDVYVAGNPEGLQGTFSRGIISGLRRGEGLLQFDAPVSPGSSGGPVVDGRGRVVGVTVASVRQGQNLNFAVPAQYLPPLVARARRTAPDRVAPETAGQPAPTVATPATAHPTLRSWAARPDWNLFVSTAIGDTGVPDKLQALLSAGLDANTRDRRGHTALHVAATRAQVELSRHLLARGADINAADAEGRTPLMLAAGLGGVDLFGGMTSPWERFWTEPPCRPEGATTASRRGEELTRWFAVWEAQRLMTLFLLGAGADVNAADREGRTALDYAALGGLTDLDGLIRRTGRLRNESECVLKLAESPALRGFRLGMSVREVTARFRKFTMPERDSCGRLTLDFQEARGTLGGLALRPQDFTGVGRLRLTFVDERLAYLRVTYSREGAGSNPHEFRAALSDSLKLAGKWRATGDGDNWDHAHVVGCDGFKVMAGYLAGPYAELHDVEALRALLGRVADEEVRGRREAEEERRKRGFKP